MTRSRAPLVLVLVLLAASACSAGDDESQTLHGTEYWSTRVVQNGEPFPLADGTRIMLRFNDGELQASAGCNSIGGGFSVQDGELRTGDLAMTAMGCDPERHAQDDFLIQVLAAAPTVTIDGDLLRLATTTATIDFIDAAIANPDVALKGTTWEIDGFLSGQTASSFVTDVRGTILIDKDTMRLFDGCASIALPVDIDGAEIRFEPVEMPAVEGCAATAGYRQSIFAALSRGALEYVIDGKKLTLATPDNVGLTLQAVE